MAAGACWAAAACLAAKTIRGTALAALGAPGSLGGEGGKTDGARRRRMVG